MNDFDKAARFGARRLDVEGFLRWLLGEKFWAAWRWRDWLDTQTLPFPGEADRRLDTVAAFDRRDNDRSPMAVVVEFLTEPRRAVLERLGEYTLRVRREYPYQANPLVQYDVIGIVVNLTASLESGKWSMAPDDCGRLGLWSKSGVRNLSKMSAPSELAKVASGRTARCVLPWLALMRGAGQPAFIEKWKHETEQEPDAEKRRDYVGLIKVFADLAGHLPAWNHALEGWDVRRSIVTLEWEAMAKLETKREDLLRILRARFRTHVTPEIDTTVQSQADLAILNGWIEVASTASDIENVRRLLGLNGGV